MLNDDDAIQIFIEESEEHLAYVENDLLCIEKGVGEIDGELINNVFRSVHTIKGGAGFLGYDTIKTLAHKMENIMGEIRVGQQKPTSSAVSALLGAADALKDMIHNLDTSNETDISAHLKALASIVKDDAVKEEKAPPVSLASNEESDSVSVEPASPQPEIIRDEEAVQIFAEESCENIEYIERDLLTLEKGGGEIDVELVNNIFRAVHTVKGGAAFLSYSNIKTLVHKMENVVGMIKGQKLEATPEIITVLLGATDSIRDMITNLDDSNNIDASVHLRDLEAIVTRTSESQPPPAKTVKEHKAASHDFPQPVDLKPQDEIKVPSAPASKSKPVKEKKGSDGSLRVNVRLLDKLMNLAGEMVLSRNQLLQAVHSKNLTSIELVKQRIDAVTSELQESIMFTRMQPIGTVFNRFPRVVRELSMELGKEVELNIEGDDVELDKTILETISAPLTHLIRNSIDHGIEMPKERQLANKDKKGKVILRASHEAGLVILEVIDDGHGMSPDKIASSVLKKGILNEEQLRHLSDKEKLHLIFMPGFSTADSVSDISGRGVGMDVVKTNLDELGGQIEISSKPGNGTTIRIKLPLTLAIISAQIVICRNERYSIPQVNLEELIRIPAREIIDRIEIVGEAPVLKLRGTLLPLLKLTDVLGITPVYKNELTEEDCDERRKNIADRRSVTTLFKEELQAGRKEVNQKEEGEQAFDKTKRSNSDRRYSKNSALHMAIVNTGNLKYGIVVDALKDAEEIVVKSLGSHLKSTRKYSGATIMGDGRISLILDVGNIAREAGLISFENSDRAMQLSAETDSVLPDTRDLHSLLLFRNGGEDQFCVPLNLVLRVIKIKSSEIEVTGGKRVIPYRDESLLLFSIDEVASVPPIKYEDDLQVIIFHAAGHEVGLLATKPINAVEMILSVDDETYQEQGLMGSVIIDGKITLLVNIYEVVKILNPLWFTPEKDLEQARERHTILVADDSSFFQRQISKTLQEEGFNTIVAEDGQLAWEMLIENAEKISMLVTDIEMPRLNGFELTERVRDDARFENLPIVAITTLADDKDVKRGKAAGVNEYLVKFNRDLLVEKVLKLLKIK